MIRYNFTTEYAPEKNGKYQIFLNGERIMLPPNAEVNVRALRSVFEDRYFDFIAKPFHDNFNGVEVTISFRSYTYTVEKVEKADD